MDELSGSQSSEDDGSDSMKSQSGRCSFARPQSEGNSPLRNDLKMTLAEGRGGVRVAIFPKRKLYPAWPLGEMTERTKDK